MSTRLAIWPGPLALCIVGTVSALDSPARLDLTSSRDLAIVAGEWRYHDAELVASRFPAPDERGQPTGTPRPAFALEPRAGGAHFDDSAWPVIAPESLSARRGHGGISFNWYRLS